MADLKGRQIGESYDEVLTKGAGGTITDGDNMLWFDPGTKINYTDIVNNLTSGGTSAPGSAENDKVLNETKAALAGGNGFSGLQEFINGISFDGGSNVLEDYEVGNWTPSDNSGAGLIFSSISTSYMRIGDLYIVSTGFTYPSTSNTNIARISGLPSLPRGAHDYMFGAGFNQVGVIGNSVSSFRVIVDKDFAQLFIRDATGFVQNNELSGKAIRFAVSFIGQ